MTYIPAEDYDKNIMNYVLLCILWVLWCFFHSFLLATGTKEWFKKRLKNKFIFYRTFYNTFSLVTVLPLLYWQNAIQGPVVIKLSPFLLLFKYVAIFLGMILIGGSFLTFDIWEFAGIRKILKRETKSDGRGMKEEKRETRDKDKKQKAGGRGMKTEQARVIKKHGFYGIVRHPMYLGAFIFCIASMTNAPFAKFLGMGILAVYIITGTVLEDRRLARELGDVYRNYQKEVPMILPKFTGKADW